MVPECPERKSKGAETGLVRLSDQVPEAYSSYSLKQTVINSAEKLSGSNPFSPKNPNFDLPIPKFISKGCLQVHILKRAFKNTSNMKSNTISTQFTKSTHFHKTINNNLNPSQIHDYEHPGYESSTTISHNNNNIN